jgi:uncharacterized membrane protein
MNMELIVLRALHVVGGIWWVGSMAFVAFFLFPSIREAGPAGGQVMQQLAKRNMMTWTPVIAVITMLAGLRLMMIVGAASPGYFASTQGMTYSMGGALAILTFFHGLFASRPVALKMADISKQMAAPDANKEALGAELKKLQAKGGLNLRITATMLLVSSLSMAIARYL